MLPAQRYHPGAYPPSQRFAQFGDDVLRQSLNAHDEAWQKLSAKRQGMRQFHTDRLEQDGFLPMPRGPHPSTPAEHPQAQYDPEEPATMQFDRPTPPAPPGGARMRHRGTQPDARDFADMGVQHNSGPPQPPSDRFRMQRAEVARYEPPEMHEMGTQGGPPPPPPPRMSVQRGGAARYDPPEMHEAGTQGGPPKPPKPGLRVQRAAAAQYEPDEEMMPAHSHGHPPPPGGGSALSAYAPVKNRLGPYAGSSSDHPAPPPHPARAQVPVYHLPDQDQEMVVAHSGGGPPKPKGGKKISIQDVPMKDTQPAKRLAEEDIGQHQKEYSFLAGNARRNSELKQKLAEAEQAKGVEGMKLQHTQEMKEAEAERLRQEESLRNLAHANSVLLGAVERGRKAGGGSASRAASEAPTRLYPTVRNHAPTIAASHGTASSSAPSARSRSPLLPVATESVGSRSPEPVNRRLVGKQPPKDKKKKE